jgi:hypothetical protein
MEHHVFSSSAPESTIVKCASQLRPRLKGRLGREVALVYSIHIVGSDLSYRVRTVLRSPTASTLPPAPLSEASRTHSACHLAQNLLLLRSQTQKNWVHANTATSNLINWLFDQNPSYHSSKTAFFAHHKVPTVAQEASLFFTIPT